MEKKVRLLNFMLCVFYHHRKEIIHLCLFLLILVTVRPTCSPETHVCVPKGLGRGHRLEAVVDMAGTSLVKYRWEVEGAVST